MNKEEWLTTNTSSVFLRLLLQMAADKDQFSDRDLCERFQGREKARGEANIITHITASYRHNNVSIWPNRTHYQGLSTPSSGLLGLDRCGY